MNKAISVGCQVAGCVLALYGVFLLLGPSWTCIIAGIALASIGVLLEAGRL